MAGENRDVIGAPRRRFQEVGHGKTPLDPIAFEISRIDPPPGFFSGFVRSATGIPPH